MDLFSKYLKLVITITYSGVFFLRIFHYGFIYRRPIAIVTECIPAILVTAVLIFIVSVIEYRILTPFQKIIEKAKKNKSELSESEYADCVRNYKKFDLAILIGEGTGFLLGASSTAILESLLNFQPLDPILFFIIILQSIGVGFLCYTIMTFRIRKILMTNMLREIGIKSVNTQLSKTLSVSICACIFISTLNMLTVPIGLIKNVANEQNIFKTFLTFSLIGAFLTFIVCGSAYSLLIRKIQETEKSISEKLHEETQNLAVATKESAATSLNQSAAVKEIVATMEDTNNLATTINSKVVNTVKSSQKSKDDIILGAEYLHKNILKLLDIMETNQKTIDGIRYLDEKINNIWEVVNLINAVASQAKIIAFNAELEANSAGAFGKNFHIVASEVRRLADNIIDSTREIKDKITDIQKASDLLIMQSKNGTEQLNQGFEDVKKLESNFEDIKNSAEETAKSNVAVSDFIAQLSSSSEQIFSTIKQISIGIENFSQATESISSISENVNDIAGLL